MSASELIGANAGTAGAGAEIVSHRAKTIVLHNSRLVCWLTMGMGVCSAFIGVCMMLMIFSLLTPISAISFMRVLAAAQWALGGLLMCLMCPALWKWGLQMMRKKVKLDERGVDFSLGTKKEPIELFMEWAQVASVKQKRVGNARQFTITGADGSYAQFNSYTFFRPRHVAKMIAERAGLVVQKV
jgi:hypothetical protein